jgi:hypothetical protein
VPPPAVEIHRIVARHSRRWRCRYRGAMRCCRPPQRPRW